MLILFIGYGAVAKCVCHVWQMISKYNITKAIIIEPTKKKCEDFPMWLNYRHIETKLTSQDYEFKLNKLLSRYSTFDLVIDLSVYVNGICILDWCQKNKIPYINTALETWEEEIMWPNTNDACSPLKYCRENKESINTISNKILQYSQNIIKNKYKGASTTALIDMGQNPGCVSLYVKCALDFLADKYDIKFSSYGELANKLGLETIHIAERDSQICNFFANNDIFYNTWSSIGYVEEAIDPVQIGYGSHEGKIPTAILIGSQVILPIRGMNMKAKSYEPMGGELVGRLIPHSENNTITNFLTYKDYRPSTYYVYDSSKISQDSLEKLKERNYNMQPNFHVLNSNEIISGFDSVGVLLLFKDKKSFWFGSIVTNDYVKKISTNINATTIQVAAGVIGGIHWILGNKNMGVCFPEAINNHQEFITFVKPLLGHIYCGFVDYKPKSNKLVDLVVNN